MFNCNICIYAYMYMMNWTCQLRGVFKIYDDLESQNEGPGLR